MLCRKARNYDSLFNTGNGRSPNSHAFGLRPRLNMAEVFGGAVNPGSFASGGSDIIRACKLNWSGSIYCSETATTGSAKRKLSGRSPVFTDMVWTHPCTSFICLYFSATAQNRSAELLLNVIEPGVEHSVAHTGYDATNYGYHTYTYIICDETSLRWVVQREQHAFNNEGLKNCEVGNYTASVNTLCVVIAQ